MQSENHDYDINDLVVEMRKSNDNQKVNNWIYRASSAFFMATSIFMITFMIDISSWRGGIDNKLENMDDTKIKQYVFNQLGAYLSLNSYIAIEKQRSLDIVDLICMMGRDANVREEELERFRTTALIRLNTSVDTGTARTAKRK